MGNETLPEELSQALYHGKEEAYLEYKGNFSWRDNPKKFEIVQTILAMANKREGGIIVIGVEDAGGRIGLSEENYNSYSHDQINQYLEGKCNQSISCKVSNIEHQEEGVPDSKKFVFIQVKETREFPLVYTGGLCVFNSDVPGYGPNVALRRSAIYVRNTSSVGNKEIETVEEWQELIERTYGKYEKETLRRAETVGGSDSNPFDEELNI